MTPDERALRDAFLAEMWPTCRELPRATKAREIKEPARRKPCPICGAEMAASNLARHINRTHSSTVDAA